MLDAEGRHLSAQRSCVQAVLRNEIESRVWEAQKFGKSMEEFLILLCVSIIILPTVVECEEILFNINRFLNCDAQGISNSAFVKLVLTGSGSMLEQDLIEQ